ncbi:hypothetical protein FSP39_009227 [Pinctada imbricata]|uniref:G-protein coupled receptors family 1 profile domain-containing protein n=1 Tax=Pinctada imbricata TaxID=66713 RepID=A0AA88XU22_PINIB|nr:hypothetical protein FSP39_009227 [Pinctada imbricata]
MDPNGTYSDSNHQLNSDEVNVVAQVPITFFYIMIFLLGSFGNGFVIFVFLKSRQLRDNTSIFIFNLAISDFLIALFVTFYGITYPYNLRHSSIFSCIIHEGVVNYLMFVSQSVLTLVSFDRFLAICHVTKHKIIMRVSLRRGLLTLTWMVPLVLATLPVYGFNFWDTMQWCNYSMILHRWIYCLYSTYMIILMVVPFVFYIQILVKAREFYRRLCPAQITSLNTSTTQILRKKRAIRNGKVMGIITVLFAICWLPFQIIQYLFGFVNVDDITVMILFNIGVLNCTVNPFIYAYQNEEIRHSVKTMLQCIKCCKLQTLLQRNGNTHQSHGNHQSGLEQDVSILQPTQTMNNGNRRLSFGKSLTPRHPLIENLRPVVIHVQSLETDL